MPYFLERNGGIAGGHWAPYIPMIVGKKNAAKLETDGGLGCKHAPRIPVLSPVSLPIASWYIHLHENHKNQPNVDTHAIHWVSGYVFCFGNPNKKKDFNQPFPSPPLNPGNSELEAFPKNRATLEAPNFWWFLVDEEFIINITIHQAKIYEHKSHGRNSTVSWTLPKHTGKPVENQWRLITFVFHFSKKNA